jgi:glycosyltransferase involved in cell wall biosynthesis
VLGYVKPGIVFLMGQPVWLSPLIRTLQPYRHSLRVVLYAPFEGNVTNVAAIRPLQMVDNCILYTECARSSVLSLAADLMSQDPAFRLPALHVLPHGVDTGIFRPLPQSRAEIRRWLFPQHPELQDAFILLNANAPYPRKRLDLTVQAFAQFAQGKTDDIFLYLHLPRADERLCRPLRECIRAAGMGHRTLINLVNPEGERLADAELNVLYNACDVGINTAMGEGWGLTSFEHAATRAAQVLPEHTVFIEHWTGAAELVEIAGKEYFFHEHAEMYVASPEDAGRKLERLYRDPAYRCSLAQSAYARATSKAYQWNVIGQRLNEILVQHNAAGNS